MIGHFDNIFPVDYEFETQNVPSRHVFWEKWGQIVKKIRFWHFLNLCHTGNGTW